MANRTDRRGAPSALLQWTGWFGFLAVLAVYPIGQLLEAYVLVPDLVGDRIGIGTGTTQRLPQAVSYNGKPKRASQGVSAHARATERPRSGS